MAEDDVLVRLDKISAQQDELKAVVGGLVAPTSKDVPAPAAGFYVPRLGRGLIVAVVLGAFYFVTSSHHNVIGDLSATVHTVTGLTGGLVAGTAIVIAGIRMAGLPVRRRDVLFDALRLMEFAFVWPVALAAAVDYASSFEDTGPLLTATAIGLIVMLFIDFGWSAARQARRVAPWKAEWPTHALFAACIVTTVLIWDLPFLNELRHQLVNVDTEAEISNIAVLAGLGCGAAAYLAGLKRKSPGH
jgi:hypothetical protein